MYAVWSSETVILPHHYMTSQRTRPRLEFSLLFIKRFDDEGKNNENSICDALQQKWGEAVFVNTAVVCGPLLGTGDIQ
jgi:hypothetical protein